MQTTLKNMTFLFYKLISYSSNKKFRFLPAQNTPGSLQHMNLEPNFIFFFFKYVNNIKKYDISGLQVDI